MEFWSFGEWSFGDWRLEIRDLAKNAGSNLLVSSLPFNVSFVSTTLWFVLQYWEGGLRFAISREMIPPRIDTPVSSYNEADPFPPMWCFMEYQTIIAQVNQPR